MNRYGLLGRTLKHSFSQGYFTRKFEAEGRADCTYQNFELADVSELPSVLSAHPDLKGLNVTIPYKEDVRRYLTEKNELVTAVGACNCIAIEGDNLIGHNTDVIGFRRSIEPQLKPHHKKGLVLGTGGAAKAVGYALSQLGIEYRCVSRRKDEGQWGYEDLDEELLSEYPLLVNTTPLGTYPNVDEAPPLPYGFITPKHFLFDLVYNPEKTNFLAEGEKQGAQISNGHRMLVEQAEESWRIWQHGKR